ncbi:hypothetical protein L1994_04150 [Methanomicrobium antiquum]|uniref:Uncharacterized protein n=1 Tax=Methanomicrobium antiquum TaxID=487686 RepID=A0AAF0FSB2_9EURY|nr:hypothetical protein [Methanomicrobium antiquum]WFN37589.1 hypothetical protein L1994_04150 [Methanomicrobium antiquum]
MSKLEDFLEPLNQGVWEVSVSKDSVTEPLGTDWKKSAINVPSPGTVASFRKGQYHVHETRTEWKVHLDRYDPKKHPVMHLLDDAPLLLMVGDTFVTLISDIRSNKTTDTKEILKQQNKSWHLQVIAGIFLALIGFNISSDPMTAFLGITYVIIPLSVTVFGLIVTANGLLSMKKKSFLKGDIPGGLLITGSGIIIFHFPADFWVTTFTVILSLWMFSSAILLLGRARKGRSAIPEGFVSRVLIGILSVILVLMALFAPDSLVTILSMILGFIIILIGILIMVNGLRLRNIMKIQISGR